MFNRIVSVDATNLPPEALDGIKRCSKMPAIFYDTDPEGSGEIIRRIGDADCVLVSWRTKLGRDVFEKCRNVRYVGLCATSFANIDLAETAKRGIVVSNVSGYGDEATAEFIFAELLSLVRGLGKYQLKEMPCELFGKTLGIVGLGAVGKQVARLGLGFGMRVVYYSRTRNPEFERKGLQFADLPALIKSSDIISLHVPKDTMIFSAKEFGLVPKGTILVDTCIGRVFEESDFLRWIKKGDNIAIFDLAVSKDYYRFRDLKNVVFPEILAARTMESRDRLGAKVIENMESFLAGRPKNVVIA
jgi:phosphoglycerate dehydrogenase-like enzyme